MIDITIDGNAYLIEEGTTVLEACKQAGINIPTLCYLEKIQAIGACRVCLVEIEGVKDLVASCVMPVSEGMVIHSNNRRIREARKVVVELLLSVGLGIILSRLLLLVLHQRWRLTAKTAVIIDLFFIFCSFQQ